jgi:ParB family transcriptional regulator, chromosome partitioning protein
VGSPKTELPWRQMIAVDHLHPNPDNPRSDFGNLAELEASIRAQGLKQPLLVTPAPELGSDRYYIEDGERRWRAMKAWNTEIFAIVAQLRPGQGLSVRNIVTALVTDVHKLNLGPMEKAVAYGRLRDEFGMNQMEISRQVGTSSSTVANSLALLELSDDTQERVRKGLLQAGEALRLVRRKRAAARRKRGGTGQAGAVWEPDWFTAKHPLARKAASLCDGRGHNSRRRLGAFGPYPGACGECWESVVRADERLVVIATAEAATAWHELQDEQNEKVQ